MSELTGGLRNSTAELARLFQVRMDMLRNRSDIVEQLRPLEKADLPSLEQVLPEPRVAVGIDGSMDYDEVLEMLLFYVAAAGYKCGFTIREKEIDFDLLNSKRTEELFTSAVVPLWEEDLLNVVPHTSEQIETDVDFRRTMERIPFALMTMAELYLACKVVSEDKIRILFLDRPFSGTYPSLYRDAAFALRLKRPLALEGLETREGTVERLDLHIATVIGVGLGYLPPRGIYLRYSGLQFLLRHPKESKKELQSSLGLTEEAFQTMLKRIKDLNKSVGGDLISSEDLEFVHISDRALTSWKRVRTLAFEIANRIFYRSTELRHPLLMDNGRWLSVMELNALNLILLEALIEESRRRQVLVIGLAKDTTATDFTRAALPTSLALSNVDVKLPGLKSDKALLTILSSANSSNLSTPWRTFAYDGCMATLIAAADSGLELRAARRTITREQLFVRCYFQLRSFQHDPEIRAPVFLYDRLFLPEYDDPLTREIMATEERREVRLHLCIETKEERSKIDNLVLLILSKCDNPEVLEAYGHNQLLYLADKLVKGEVSMMKGLLRGVVDLELTPLARREKVFSIARRFRDLRAESESARRQSALTRSEVRIR
jgi:hypothetical protein